jgi:hypothetical protein
MHSEKVAGASVLNKRPPFFLYVCEWLRERLRGCQNWVPGLFAQIQLVPGGRNTVDILSGQQSVSMAAGGTGGFLAFRPFLRQAVDTLASESFGSLLFTVNASIDHTTHIIGNFRADLKLGGAGKTRR